ncbi:hypothetical protein KC315_g3250 [Hortaea werneckii]|nr:hypothetical protein KC315_g3250 [Hortaea werneckii]
MLIARPYLPRDQRRVGRDAPKTQRQMSVPTVISPEWDVPAELYLFGIAKPQLATRHSNFAEAAGYQKDDDDVDHGRRSRLLPAALWKIWKNGSPVLVCSTSSRFSEQKAKVRMAKKPRQALGATDHILTCSKVFDAFRSSPAIEVPRGVQSSKIGIVEKRSVHKRTRSHHPKWGHDDEHTTEMKNEKDT